MKPSKSSKTQVTSKSSKTSSQKGKPSAAEERRAKEARANDLAMEDDLRNALHDLGERIVNILEHPKTPEYVRKALMRAVTEIGNNMPEANSDPQHVRWVMNSII
jgi:hypothetical protein